MVLNENMNPKIADFWMARISKQDETGAISNRVVGSCFISSAYAMEGTFSVKSDVFSFGILILEYQQKFQPLQYWWLSIEPCGSCKFVFSFHTSNSSSLILNQWIAITVSVSSGLGGMERWESLQLKVPHLEILWHEPVAEITTCKPLMCARKCKW